MIRYLLAFLGCLGLLLQAANSQTTGNYYEAENDGGYYGDPYYACVQSHQSRSANSGLTPTLFSTVYGDDGGIKAVWCRYDNGGSGYWGTDGSAWRRCPSGKAPTGDHRACERATESAGINDCGSGFGDASSANVGNPIDVGSGAKIQIEQDFAVGSGRLHFTRIYRSIGISETALGKNWASNLHPQVSGSYLWYKGYFNLVLENGRVLRFIRHRGNWLPPSIPWSNWPAWVSKENHDRDDIQFEIVELDATNLELHYPNGRIQAFQFPGSGDNGPKLIEDRWPDGYTLTFNYGTSGNLDDVTDSFGNMVAFTYNSDGSLASTTDPEGNLYEYNHHIHEISSWVIGTHNLNEVLMPDSTPGDSTDNPKREYLYESATKEFLTGIIDERGIRTNTWVYGADLRASSSEGPAGLNSYTLVEDTSGDKVTVTNPLGKDTVYNFTRYRGIRKLASIDGVASAQCAASTSSQSYNSRGQLTSHVDREGQTTTITPDASTGLPTSVTVASGTPAAATTTYTWDYTTRKPTQIERGDLRASYVYDANENVQTLTLTDLSSHTLPYVTSGSQRVWAYNWGANGLLNSVDGPLSGSGDTTSFSYDSAGFLTSVTDANGHTTNINSVNGNGQPLQMTDANGLVTSMSYTPRGWLSSVTSGGETTSFSYDDAGNLTRTDFPGGGYITYSYNDAGWLTSAVSSQGESAQYTHDNMGNVLTRSISGGGAYAQLDTTYSYDELGRLRSILGGAGDSVSYSYDRSDRRTSVQDGAGRAWLSAFDALDRVISETDPNFNSVASAWNENNDLTAFTDANTYQTSYTRNGFGDVIREVSPDTGTTDYWYDAAGNVTKIVDASGREVNYAYDSGSRLISETYPADATLNLSYTYDNTSAGNAGKGRLTSVNGVTVDHAYTYDIRGRLTSEALSVGSQTYPTQYGFNSAGHMASLILPSGREVHYTNDTFGRVTSISTKANASAPSVPVASAIQRTAFGPVSSYALGNGTDVEYEYDNSYRLSKIKLNSGASTLFEQFYTYNTTGRVSWVLDTVHSTANATYTYTADGRLESANGLWGDFDWTYDGVGNRLSEAEHFSGAPSVTESYVYGASDNRLMEVEDSATNPLRDFVYEANGDLQSDMRTGTGLLFYTYGQDGRLASVQKTGTTLSTYAYDAFERRVLRSDATGTTHFVFAPNGALLGEYDASGAVIQEYVWLEGKLIASFDSFGTATYVQTGHLAQPLLFADSTGAVVWRGEISPWGEVTHISGSANSGDLRLPGQWAEMAAGLSQNWHRDYDPSLGRYIEADPLGIAAGQSVYGYVRQDPLNLIDPEGLQDGLVDHRATPEENKRRLMGPLGDMMNAADPLTKTGFIGQAVEAQVCSETKPPELEDFTDPIVLPDHLAVLGVALASRTARMFADAVPPMTPNPPMVPHGHLDQSYNHISQRAPAVVLRGRTSD